MTDTRKEFIKKAFENGYSKTNCGGWDWIEANLAMLDYILQTEEYKAGNKSKHKCLPILMKGENFSADEEDVLETAWYLNNKKVSNAAEQQYQGKMLAAGWALTNTDMLSSIAGNGKYYIVLIEGTNFLGGAVQKEEKLKLVSCGEHGLYWMTARAKKIGYRAEANVFYKENTK